MPFFLGKKTIAIGNDQPKVAGAGLVYARIVDFIENSVAGGEPYLAVAG
jgi:hypothetical protein